MRQKFNSNQIPVTVKFNLIVAVSYLEREEGALNQYNVRVLYLHDESLQVGGVKEKNIDKKKGKD